MGDGGQFISDGPFVSLTLAGAPSSKLEFEGSKPAKLTFEGRFVRKTLGDGEGDETRTLAWIEGELSRGTRASGSLTFKGKLGDDGKPVGLVPQQDLNADDGGDDADDAPENDPTKDVRVFRFRFDERQFKDVVGEPHEGDLHVLVDPARFHYCEVLPKLELGAEEEAAATNDVLDVLITKRNPAAPPVRRVRLVGMLFDANKSFLLPQALPGINTVVEMHREYPEDRVLIVGHADANEEASGNDIALARAKILGGYLTSKPDEWVKWFGKDKPARSRWGTREVQLMLSVLPTSEEAFYAGYASGVTDDKTTAAIKSFQESKQLPPDGRADGKTIKAIIEAYMDLEDTSLSEDIVPVVHGCEGRFDDDATDDGLPPDDRRVDVFFFDGKIRPKPPGETSAPGSAQYPAWRRRLVETRDFEHHGIHVQIIDSKKQPVPFAEVHLEGPVTDDAVADDHGFVSFFGLVAGDYVLSAKSHGIKIGKFPLTYPTTQTVPGHQKTEAAAQADAAP